MFIATHSARVKGEVRPRWRAAINRGPSLPPGIRVTGGGGRVVQVTPARWDLSLSDKLAAVKTALRKLERVAVQRRQLHVWRHLVEPWLQKPCTFASEAKAAVVAAVPVAAAGHVEACTQTEGPDQVHKKYIGEIPECPWQLKPYQKERSLASGSTAAAHA